MAATHLGLQLEARAQVPVGRVAVSYEEQTRNRRQHKRPAAPPSTLPSADEADALLDLDRDLFTEDAWQGMQSIRAYAAYLDTLEEVEDEHPACTANRLLLEHTWQVVANEFFDVSGKFSQAAWARQLQATLQRAGGCIERRAEAYAAAKNMVATLGDKYTDFLAPSQFARAMNKPQPREREYLAMQFTGVGLQLGPRARGGGWVVEGPLAGSPAEEAGILGGEALLEIDFYRADLLAAAEVESLLRGPASSGVLLKLRSRDGVQRELYMERRPLPQPAVREMRVLLASTERPAAYVRLHYMGSETTRQLAAALRRAEAERSLGVIIDLRNNPGGVFEEAIAEAALLLGDGCKIVETVRGSGATVDAAFWAGRLSREVFPDAPGRLTALPVVVLTNGRTASAAEVLAGALQGNHRAVLVGERTFGKGVVQYYFPSAGDRPQRSGSAAPADGSGLKVTVAKYLTPGGYDVSASGGLMPDVACSDYPHGGLPTPADDRCIAAALSLLARHG
ncbi:hypothetical protein WJX81_000274 [Elliptochloris bilobata]|uniref:Tail specific protease domain-containing protein n=1 Tax=Elliptochloris bilobata TaxID=381761 RepID=A0AAW1RTN1_9CHLO